MLPGLELLPEALRSPFAGLPRTALGQWPTPLEECPRLAAALGLRQMWVKRDDLSGPALGGHKVRQIEYMLGAALAQGYQGVVLGVGSGSNHARLLAPICRKLGLWPVVIINLEAPPPVLRGNLLLTALTGADIRYLAAPDHDRDMTRHCQAVAEDYAAKGIRLFPLVFPLAGVIGATAGIGAMLELRTQTLAAGLEPEALMLATGNGFLAGLALAAKALNWPIECRGAPAAHWADPATRTAEFGNLLAEQLRWPQRLAPGDLRLTAAPPNAWQAEAEVFAAIRLAAETEGLFFDPVHTGPALAALRMDIASGAVAAGSSVVFWHTGGVPALFAADDRLTAHLRDE